MLEEVNPKVNVVINVYEAKSGKLISTEKTHNLVVDSGLNLLKEALNTGSTSPIARIAFGTSNSVVLPSDTSLISEVFRENLLSKVPGNKSLICNYFLNDINTNDQVIREVGLFTLDGTMYARVVLPTPIYKTNLVVVAFSWTLSWGSV
jgi:hypothetical protein